MLERNPASSGGRDIRALCNRVHLVWVVDAWPPGSACSRCRSSASAQPCHPSLWVTKFVACAADPSLDHGPVGVALVPLERISKPGRSTAVVSLLWIGRRQIGLLDPDRKHEHGSDDPGWLGRHRPRTLGCAAIRVPT